MRRHGLLRSFLVGVTDGGGCGGRRSGVLGFSSRRRCRGLKAGLRLRRSLGCLLQQLLRDLLASVLVHRFRFWCFCGGRCYAGQLPTPSARRGVRNREVDDAKKLVVFQRLTLKVVYYLYTIKCLRSCTKTPIAPRPTLENHSLFKV